MSTTSKEVDVTLASVLEKCSSLQTIAAKFGFTDNVKMYKHPTKNMLCLVIEESGKQDIATQAKRALSFNHEVELLLKVKTMSFFISSISDTDKVHFEKNVVLINDKSGLASLFGKIENYHFQKIENDDRLYLLAMEDRKRLYDSYMAETHGSKSQSGELKEKIVIRGDIKP